jgi:hypothetical protein
VFSRFSEATRGCPSATLSPLICCDLICKSSPIGNTHGVYGAHLRRP